MTQMGTRERTRVVADLEDNEASILTGWCDSTGWSRAAWVRALIAAHPDGLPPPDVVELARRFNAERGAARRAPRLAQRTART
jgi:hypothetical protein